MDKGKLLISVMSVRVSDSYVKTKTHGSYHVVMMAETVVTQLRAKEHQRWLDSFSIFLLLFGFYKVI